MSDHTKTSGQGPPARFHDKFTWPLVVAVVAAMLLFGGGVVLKFAPRLIDGCDPETTEIVRAGERAYQQNNYDQAADFGARALAIAPNCKCAHLLEARLALEDMRQALRLGQAEAARRAKLSCWVHVVRATGPRGITPELAGIYDACGATQGS